MAVPEQGSIGARIDTETPAERRRRRRKERKRTLDKRIDRWNDLNDFLENPGSVTGVTGAPVNVPQSEIDAAERERDRIEDQIDGMLDRHPGLGDHARDQGYPTGAGIDGAGHGWEGAAGGGTTGGSRRGGRRGSGSGSDSRGPSGSSKGPGSNGRSNTSRNRSNNRAGAGGGENSDHLPGRRGKDYTIVRGPGGQHYVVYKIPLPNGKTASVSFRVPEKLLDRYGIGANEGRKLTRSQMKGLEYFGPINEVKLKRGEHPVASWMREMERKFGMAPGMLKNKEVMAILFAAHVGKWDQAELMGALEQTKWFQKKTDQRTKWLFETNEADRKTQINTTFNQLQDYVRQTFGGADWVKAGLTTEKLKAWAEKIASGAVGWDLSEAQSRIDNLARGTEGSILQASEEEAAAAAMAHPQKWEDIFEQVREESIRMLGYQGKPSKQTLEQFAKKMAAGEMTQADFDQYLRKQKKALYPFLDDDEAWMNRADTFRSIAQDELGRDISYKDRLLRDLVKVDDQGNPVNQGRTAMSAWDFQKKVRSDKRWDTSRTAAEEGYDFLTVLDATFNGTGGS